MKVHMVKITRGIWGSDSTKTGSLCGRLNNASRDGMNVTSKPREVTCAFCRRFNLIEAAKRLRTDEDVSK